jgi:hypothetical protein
MVVARLIKIGGYLDIPRQEARIYRKFRTSWRPASDLAVVLRLLPKFVP